MSSYASLEQRSTDLAARAGDIQARLIALELRQRRMQRLPWILLTVMSWLVGGLGSCAYRQGAKLSQYGAAPEVLHLRIKKAEEARNTLEQALLNASGDVLRLQKQLKDKE